MKTLLLNEKKENLATFGVADTATIKIDSKHLNEVDGREYYKNNPPLETPTSFSTQSD